jgi:hypothetical protein
MKHKNYINIGVSFSSFIYTFKSLFLSLVIGWAIYTYFFKVHYNFKEGFDPNALLTYDSNSPSNTHNVNLVNDKYSCSNFCGPNAQCAITREQCSSDVDCKGCQPPITAPPKYLTNLEVKPLDDAGKLTLSQTPQYSSLTTDIGTFATSLSGKPGSLDEGPPAMYQGFDKWTKSFNYGLKLSNEKLTYADTESAGTLNSADALILPQYPVTKTATGLFYDAGPNASNARL